MPKITTRLTALEIERAKPRDKDYTLFDGEGLCLRIRKTGRKSWLFNYRSPNTGKRTNLGIGTYPYTSLKKARAITLDYRELLEQRIDPQQHLKNTETQQQQEEKNTVMTIAQEWFQTKAHSISEDHARDIWRSMELHLFPCIGTIPITQLKPLHIIECLRPIEKRGALETVRRLCQRINEIMDFALNCGYVELNTLARVNRVFKTPKKQNLPALKPSQLPFLMETLSTANVHLITRALAEFQLHSMLRPGEASRVKWSYFDFEKRICTIPASVMKAGREHQFPLSPSVIVILETLRPITGNYEFVFVSANDQNKPRHPQTVNALLKRIGFSGLTVSHGLRSIASTTLNEHGHDKDLVESALAHLDPNETRSAYNRAKYLKRRRKLMKWWSKHIVQATGNNFSIVTAYKRSQ